MIDAAKIEELREDNRRKRALLMDYLTANAVLDLAAASLAREGEDEGYDYVMAAETLCNGIQAWGSGTAFDKCREALQAAFEAGRDKASTRICALASEKEGLRRERDEAIATSKRNWDDCGKMHNALGRALQIVCLSEELCDAVDAEAEDIGTGKRNSLRILQEIGPLVEKARKQAEEAFNGWPRF